MIDPIEIRPTAQAVHYKTLRWISGTRKQIVVRVVDEDGVGVRLDAEPENIPAERPQFGYQTEVSPGTVSIRLLVLNEVMGQTSSSLLLDIPGRLVTEGCDECGDCDGLVEFIIPAGKDFCPGVYRAQIARFVHGGYQVDAYPCYLSVEPSLTSAHQWGGMISLAEVRLALGDNEIGEVSLLDSFEFEDTEIAAAIRWVVDKWNDTPPPVSRYTYFNFPFRYWWIKGACIELLRIAAKRYERNRLAYQAGGVTVNDQDKAESYEAIARRMYAEFDEWFKMEKRRQNMDRAWSTVSFYG